MTRADDYGIVGSLRKVGKLARACSVEGCYVLKAA